MLALRWGGRWLLLLLEVVVVADGGCIGVMVMEVLVRRGGSFVVGHDGALEGGGRRSGTDASKCFHLRGLFVGQQWFGMGAHGVVVKSSDWVCWMDGCSIGEYREGNDVKW